MAYAVKMPKLGLEMDRGTLVEWHVSEGESVEEGEVIAEVESEKTTGEVTARESGVLRRVLLAAGESAEPGASIGIVAGPDEDVSDLEASAGAAEPSAPDEVDAGASTAESSAATSETSAGARTDGAKASPRARRRAEELGVDLTAIEGTGPQGSITEGDVEAAASTGEAASTGGEAETAGGGAEATAGSVKASPRARRLAKDLGVDLTGVEGTGPQGSITEDDVIEVADAESTKATAEASDAASADAWRIREERPLTGMRRTIAERLGESYREAVHVTEHRTADAEALFAAVDAAESAHGADVSVNDVLLAALSAALSEHPAFNATFEEGVHYLHESHNVCVAVDLAGSSGASSGDETVSTADSDGGLVAPVVRGIDSLSLGEIAEERRRVTERALSREYTMDDLAGGTFTVSNLGVLGVESFDPVINPPQVAILGVNAVERRAVPDGDGGVAFRRHLPLDLSFDHRVVDGADAARFLGTLVERVENPWPLLDGVEPEAVEVTETTETTDAAAEGGSATVRLPEGRVSARVDSDLSGSVAAGSFEYDFDVTEEFGDGAPSAPRPVDLFLGSLSACLASSIGVQAAIRDLDPGGIEVEATAAEDDRGSVESIDVRVTVDADADEDTVERMVTNGERTCHVSELLREDLPVSLSWERA
ncbi:2-oxo acid dehydrogenase subunit E2 [Halegenticoccus soli]|uniref:2-oxo acid dehydrogenase subunit E2 n=1 Tax=Halegenticoccus soli TaxID=1985678 RepID=UPI000C6D5DD0